MKTGQLREIKPGIFIKKIRSDKPFTNQQKAISKELGCDYSYIVIDNPDTAKHNGYLSLIEGVRVDYTKYNLLIIKT